METKENKKNPDLNETLQEINDLVYKPGYLYSLLIIILHDLFLPLESYGDVDWWSRISYQEAGFLFGLLIKSPLDINLFPSEKDSSTYINTTYRLLKQMHDCYSLKAFSAMMEETLQKQKKDPSAPYKTSIFTSSEAIVESVFYGDSGAYDFQYWETAPDRYLQDKSWIIKNLGFSIEDAVILLKATKKASERKRLKVPPKDNFTEICKWAFNVFSIKPEEIRLKKEVLQNLLSRFSVIPGQSNLTLNNPSDYNELEIKPLIKISDSYLLPISFDLARSIDESPFYWVKELDESYFPTALKHRGDYTEEVAYKILKKVFGDSNVYKAVKIQRQKGEGVKKKGLDYTDIDVLVLLGNKAIVVQAKSKKMTFPSRKGNLTQLGIDFKKAVQDAYGQGLESRNHILTHDAVFLDAQSKEIVLPESIGEVYILSVTTDNYPALYMQVHAFLERKEGDPWPIAINIFDLDLLATYLTDPYDFLYYVNQRVFLADKIMGGSEIASLGYHLDQRLFLDPTKETTHIAIAQDFAQLIDDDIIRQKYGSEEDKKKSRIRQKWKNDSFIELVSQIKSTKDPRAIDAVFFLYSLSSETADKLVETMKDMKSKSLTDQKPHTMAMPLDGGLGGITYVVKYEENGGLYRHLMTYSIARKYLTKFNEWLGLGSYAKSTNMIDAVTYTKDPWKPDPRLQKMAESVIKPGQVVSRKIGRNDPCYCGSGKKYKKCCL